MSLKIQKGMFSTFPHLMCKGLPAYDQITFIWLFHHANADGVCFPSINTLASECGLSRDSIKRSLNNLESRGYIEKENRKVESGGNTSNLYTVFLLGCANSTEVGAISSYPPGAIGIEGSANSTTNYNHLTKINSFNNKNICSPDGERHLAFKNFGDFVNSVEGADVEADDGAAITRRLTKEEREELDKETAARSSKAMKTTDPMEGFDEFWKAYPRKQGKLQAQKSWKTKKRHKLVEEIVSDIDFRMTHHQPNGWLNPKTGALVEGTFIQLPASYLNQERWEDEQV